MLEEFRLNTLTGESMALVLVGHVPDNFKLRINPAKIILLPPLET